RSSLSDKHWLYFPEDKFIFFRVGFPTNFSSSVAPPGKSSLYAEVAYAKYHPLNQAKLTRRIMQDLRRAKILSSKDTVEVCLPLDIKYGYVIYDHNYKKSTELIHRFLQDHQVYAIGRYGRWKYMSMEDTILDALAIAAFLSGKQ
ncbi:MAG: hypothetical protein JW714_04605, partial [Candidatus Omnitrophica bacterium]|nr:hypothetical protein [Candidatus Omnitrophota bacterium]